jgi:hypothetical protein
VSAFMLSPDFMLFFTCFFFILALESKALALLYLAFSLAVTLS